MIQHNEDVTIGAGPRQVEEDRQTKMSPTQLEQQTRHSQPLRTHYKGKTLIDASKSGDLPLLFLLISWGNSVNQTESTRGCAPMHWAAFNGHEECVALLLHNGANPTVTDTQEGQTPLMWACMGGHMSVVRLLLERFRVDPFSQFDVQHCSTIVHATQSRHVLIVHYLVSMLQRTRPGATIFDRDVNNPLLLDKERHTVLTWAAYNGHLPSLKYWCNLLFTESNYDPEIIWGWLTAVDVHKRTALHWCARQGYNNVMRYLLSIHLLVPGKRTGAVIGVLNWKDNDGHTALQWAIERNHSSVVNTLTSFIKTAGVLDSSDTATITIEDDDDEQDEEAQIIGESRPSLSNTIPSSLYVKPETNWEMMKTAKQAKRFGLAFVIYPIAATLIAILPALIVIPGLIALIGAAVLMSRKLLAITSNKKEERDAVLFGVYMGTMTLGFIVYYFMVYPIIGGFFQTSIFTILYFTALACFFYVIQIDPGYIYAAKESEQYDPITFTKDEQEILEQVIHGTIDQRSICMTCMIKKPLRSKHDRVTDHCVARFDHYCSWLNMPVGSKNHMAFMAFLYSTLSLAVFFIVTMIKCQINVQEANMGVLELLFVHSPLITYEIGYMGLVAFFLCVLTFSQTKNVFVNMTGNENMYSDKYPWIVHAHNARPSSFLTRWEDKFMRNNLINLFDRGYLGNLVEFVAGKTVQWDRVYSWHPTPYARAWLSRKGIQCPENVDLTSSPQSCCSEDQSKHGHAHH
jgi:palmitoyltransferase